MANAAVSFCFAFFYQAILVARIMGMSDLGIGVGSSNSAHANLMRFLSGELFPDLKPKWAKSIAWAFASFLLVFVTAAILDV